MYYTPSTDLPSNYELFENKRKQLNELINALQLEDVKTDEAFEATTKRIKRQILLSPVTIESPIVTDLSSGTRQVGTSYGNYFGGTQNVHEVSIEFKFTGSSELFEYMPANVPIPMGVVYQPSGNSVPVEVTITEMDKQKALSEANSNMETTFAIVKGNNDQAKEWSERNEPILESALKKRRDDLLSFFN